MSIRKQHQPDPPGVEQHTYKGVTFQIWRNGPKSWKAWTRDHGEGWAKTREQAIEMVRAAIDGEFHDDDNGGA
jgi:hypothetical protein